MTKSKFLLIITIMLMFTMSAYAQERPTGGDGGGIDIILFDIVDGHHTNDVGDDEIIWDVKGGTKTDCNNNGIDDLDEFLPPNCSGQLITSETGPSRAPELDASDIATAWLQCPDGWIYTDDGHFACS